MKNANCSDNNKIENWNKKKKQNTKSQKLTRCELCVVQPDFGSWKER